MSSSIPKNILTSGGWTKLKHLSCKDVDGNKIRVYLKPEKNIESAIKAIQTTCDHKPREFGSSDLEKELETKIYLLRMGSLLKLVECKNKLNAFFTRIIHYKLTLRKRSGFLQISKFLKCHLVRPDD